jgi:RNA polymerase-binding transcription factor DksA
VDVCDLADPEIERERAEGVRRVREALEESGGEQLIEDGRVICIDCDVPIDPRRLVVFPHAVRCTECQGIADRKDALYVRRP